MYPLRFHPVFKDYIWGGQRLEQILGKPTGNGNWAESWEIVDHANGQSVVRAGEWSGKTLRQLLTRNGPEIVGHSVYEQISGPAVPENLVGRFPLLLKFLDANRVLSVQVHPDDAMGATLSPPDLGKTEAWYVIDAKPDSKIYAGLKDGVGPAELREAIQKGETESVLNSFVPNSGDCIFITAGTVHAIGSGLLVCEIQQASDTTFRLFDWNRVDADGNARPLHVEQGLNAIDFALGPVGPSQATQVEPQVESLVRCDKFSLNRWTLSKSHPVGGDGQFRILAVVDGEVSVESDPCSEPMKVGQSMLVPASCGQLDVCPVSNTATVLEIGGGA